MDDYARICDELAYIEASESLRVLYAVDAGSHSWGWASPGSDFDVRFVYLRPISDYLRLERGRDTREFVIDGDLDIVGWDLDKFLRLMMKSNPSVVEWLSSDIVYHEETGFEEVKRRLDECFDPVSCAWHYYGMAKKHDSRYLKGDSVPIKRYLHLTRAILACKWCIRHFKPVPMAYETLLRDRMEPELAPFLESMLETKRNGADSEPIEHIEALDEWVFTNLDELPGKIQQYVHRKKPNPAVFDEIFLRMLGLTA